MFILTIRSACSHYPLTNQAPAGFFAHKLQSRPTLIPSALPPMVAFENVFAEIIP